MKATKEFCHGLRNLDRMVVRLKGDIAKVEMIFEETSQKTGKKIESEMEFPLTPREDIFTSKSGDTFGSRRETHEAFSHIYNYGSLDAFRVIVREGDEIRFEFRENGNGYIRAATITKENLFSRGGGGNYCEDYDRIHYDELVVSIKRNGKTIVRELPIDHSVCPDNSARMIQ